MDLFFLPTDANSSKTSQLFCMNAIAGYPTEGSHISGPVLKHVSQDLREDVEDDGFMFQNTLLSPEKSFFAHRYPFSKSQAGEDQNAAREYTHSTGNTRGSYGCGSHVAATDLFGAPHEHNCMQTPSMDNTLQFITEHSSYGDALDWQVKHPLYHPLVPGLLGESLPDLLCEGGSGKREAPELLPQGKREGKCRSVENESEPGVSELWAVYARVSEPLEQPEMFDKVLLSNDGYGDEGSATTPNESLQHGPDRMVNQFEIPKGTTGGITQRRRRSQRKFVDLTMLLMKCAEAVAGNDCRNATELLLQIRKHSSPFGNGTERMSHWIANALEARLTGAGKEAYLANTSKRAPVASLESRRFLTPAYPFMKISTIFATQMIMEQAEKANRLHIIDFGILLGLKWPYLIQCLSRRKGGPPVLRITGIGLTQPGLGPAEGVQETGSLLEKYCQRFNVPFEYNVMVKPWERIRSDDLKIDSNEVVVVNCLYRSRYLVDETVLLNSPRDAVLNLIKQINPHLFIHGIINGAYNAPFFISRFREALSYFSTIFDMFEANAPREDHARMVLEEEIYGKEILNVIACEGFDRVERPETYKQWQVRHLRAGFRKLPLNQEMMKKLKEVVKLHYHKDFLVDEDNQWMIQGWKGRTLFALSCWRPA